MSKVYVIIEACEALHDEYLSYEENMGVAESRLAAEVKIEKLKEKIMTDAAANGWMATDFTSPANGISKVLVDNEDMLWSDKREYTWRIEEHELIKES